jgi:hypothetical protein
MGVNDDNGGCAADAAEPDSAREEAKRLTVCSSSVKRANRSGIKWSNFLKKGKERDG